MQHLDCSFCSIWTACPAEAGCLQPPHRFIFTMNLLLSFFLGRVRSRLSMSAVQVPQLQVRWRVAPLQTIRLVRVAPGPDTAPVCPGRHQSCSRPAALQPLLGLRLIGWYKINDICGLCWVETQWGRGMWKHECRRGTVALECQLQVSCFVSRLLYFDSYFVTSHRCLVGILCSCEFCHMKLKQEL